MDKNHTTVKIKIDVLKRIREEAAKSYRTTPAQIEWMLNELDSIKEKEKKAESK